MDKYIESFPQQLLDALEAGQALPDFLFPSDISNVLICGMGGSGIGGALVRHLVQKEMKVPVVLQNEYDLPAFADEHTFVIISSYSGNTEETLSAFQQALAKKSPIVCITTGGKVKEIAERNKIPVAEIPAGMPPRAGLGYSLIAQLFVLWKAGFISDDFIRDTGATVILLKDKQEEIKKKAKKLAEKCGPRFPVFYSSSENGAIAARWKQQCNENANRHAFWNTIPEMNHNEMVGFDAFADDLAVFFLRNATDHKRIQLRFDLTRKVTENKVSVCEEVFSEGNSAIERMFFLIHTGDWFSYYLSEIGGVDAMKIEVLEWLKIKLSEPI